MNIARWLTEAPPSIRWHRGRLLTALLYRRAFADIGRGTVIVSPRQLRGVGGISIGRDCAIYAGAWLQTEAGGTIRVGDGNYFGHDVHIHAIDSVSVGDNCVFADGVFVASTDHGRDDRSAVRGTGPIAIGSRVFLGQRAVILGGVTIGDGATVGAGAVVTHDLAAGAVVVGVPARPISRPHRA